MTIELLVALVVVFVVGLNVLMVVLMTKVVMLGLKFVVLTTEDAQASNTNSELFLSFELCT